jgi:pantoate--beta-alanine ligase
MQPDVAVFGQKDFQQLAVIRRMVTDLDIGVEIVGIPTVREPDGLAISSRNQLLSEDDRRAAVCIVESLRLAEQMLADGERDTGVLLGAATKHIEAEPRARLEYVVIVDPVTLEPAAEVRERVVMLAAVWFGEVRLIDNLLLSP